MNNVVKEKLLRLIKDVSDSAFDCGEADDEQDYLDLLQRATDAKEALVQFVETIVGERTENQ